jgi:hypothetical protein
MKTTLILLAGLIISAFAQAQTIQHMDVFVQDDFSHSISVTNGDTTVTVNAFKSPKMFVVLNDTANISSFTVKLGSTSGGNDIFEKTFSFADEGTFQDGTSYTRDGNYLHFSLGQFSSLSAYYASINATVNGTQQSAISYSGQ